MRMSWKWSYLEKWTIPPHFAKILIFTSILPSFSGIIFVVLWNSAPMPNPFQWPPLSTMTPPSLTPLPLQQLCHHLPSPLPLPLPHQLASPTTTNQPHWAHTMTEVVWALGNLFFQVLFFSFQLTNVSFAFSRFYPCYSPQDGAKMAHPHPCHHYKHLIVGWNEQLAQQRWGGCNDEKKTSYNNKNNITGWHQHQ